MNYSSGAMAKLTTHRYGKARVRVLKILRREDVHTIKEIEVAAMLNGDFDSSYTAPAGDNTRVVPTDTIKNTINVLAKEHLGEEIERFALILSEHFLKRYAQVRGTEIEVSERGWNRMEINGKPHPHSFRARDEARKFTRVIGSRNQHMVQSGIRDLVILKSTGSGFERYPKDEFTTLPETADRILATSFSATWTYAKAPERYDKANDAILDAMLKIFAENYSPSAQTSLFQMAEAALTACGEISHIDLAMPNKHYLLINLSPFGLENKNEVFVPTAEPHGQIEASVARDG
jgi:urate oxidase